jgi:mRNA-degrading endonuclease YafQ of YafQ-DinJ toxin-antitoxin module
VNYIFKVSPQFRRSFEALTPRQRQKAREVYCDVFKRDPYSRSLRTHIIRRLSALYGRKIMSATIERNLKVVFYQEGNVIKSVDIGTHDIYG